MSRNQISWWLWAPGTVLVALSWFNIVSSTIGWCGFGLGLLGSVIGWGLVPPGRSRDPVAPSEAPVDRTGKSDD